MRRFAAHTRTNRVHLVVASDCEAAALGLKAWITRRLVEARALLPNTPLWSRHASTECLWTVRSRDRRCALRGAPSRRRSIRDRTRNRSKPSEAGGELQRWGSATDTPELDGEGRCISVETERGRRQAARSVRLYASTLDAGIAKGSTERHRSSRTSRFAQQRRESIRTASRS
jgi:hypothetical protein